MPATKPVSIVVAALAPSFGIGYKNQLPWRLRQEMKYFKALTTLNTEGTGLQNAVVMGRKTWDSIPAKFRPLPGRVNAVVSRSVATNAEEKDGALFFNSLEAALDKLQQRSDVERVFVIGGAEIYNHCLRQGIVQNLFITEIKHTGETEVQMDTFLDASLIQQNYEKITEYADLEALAGMSVAQQPITEGDFEYVYTVYKKK